VCLLAKHIHAKFQCPSFFPDGFGEILKKIPKKKLVFQKSYSAKFKKIQIVVCSFKVELAKHVHAKFQLFSLYPDELRQIGDLFSGKFRI
jgi:hypothetical protein